MSIDASQIMTTDVVTVGPEASVAEVAGLLAARRISAVPVRAADGTLLGMISEGDLLRPFARSNELRRDWWLGVLAEGTDIAPQFLEYLRTDRKRAGDLMSTPVISAAPDTGLAELAELLTAHGIKRVPIVKDHRLVGIVSRADIVTAIARTKVGAA